VNFTKVRNGGRECGRRSNLYKARDEMSNQLLLTVKILYIATVNLRPGAFNPVLEGFLSLLLESLAPKAPSPTCDPIPSRFMLPKFHNNWMGPEMGLPTFR